jgi:hypothetical protein
LNEGIDISLSRIVAYCSPLGRQVDLGIGDARNALEFPLDSAHARSARHAFNIELNLGIDLLSCG